MILKNNLKIFHLKNQTKSHKVKQKLKQKLQKNLIMINSINIKKVI